MNFCLIRGLSLGRELALDRRVGDLKAGVHPESVFQTRLELAFQKARTLFAEPVADYNDHAAPGQLLFVVGPEVAVAGDISIVTLRKRFRDVRKIFPS